ncbi:MAG: transporter substrate-binding domain-containing protein [Pseudomonadota bacterium]
MNSAASGVSSADFIAKNASTTIVTKTKSNQIGTSAISSGQKLANNLAVFTARSIFNLDTSQLINILQPRLEDNHAIKALHIIESVANATLITFYRNGDNTIYNQEIPDSILNLDQFTADISFEGEKIGKVTIYYVLADESQLNNIDLTEQEKYWINSNTIKVGIEPWAPMIYYENNQAKGLVGEILNLVIDKTGLKVELINKSWDDLLSAFKNKTIDLLPDTYNTPERARYGLFSKPYFTVREQIYVKQANRDIKSFEDLSGKKLAVIKGFATIELIHKYYPDIEIIETTNFKQSVQWVLTGKVDALFESQISAQDFFQEHSISGVKGIHQFSIKANKLHFFTQKDNPLLQSILQKGLDALSKQEKIRIKDKWLGADNPLYLTESEQAWLDKKIPVRYVYDIDWAPFEWVNVVGEHTGIIADILKLIEVKSGMDFVPIKTQSWSDAVNVAKERNADMYSGVGHTKERLKYMAFTDKNIFSTYYVFVSRNNEEYIEGFDNLSEKRVAVVGGYTIHGILKENKPTLALTLLKGTQEGFNKLLNKEIDVFVVNAVTAKYFLNLNKFKTLSLAYKTQYKLNLRIAIRKDWPGEVISIINKSLMKITDKERSDIYDKWAVTNIKTEFDYALLIKIALLFMAVVTIFIVWNRRLNTLVNNKTQDLELQKSTLEKLLINFDKNVISNKIDKNGVITYVSDAFCDISGYSKEELIGQSHNMIRHSDMSKEVLIDLWDTIQAGKIWKGEVKNRTKSGGYYWVNAVITPETDDQGNITGFSVIRHDITDKKALKLLSDNLEEQVEQKTRDVQASEEKTRLLLTSVGEGVFGVGVDGLVNFINPAALQMLSYNENEILGQKIHPLIHHSYADSSAYPVEKCPMYHAFKEGKTSQVDNEVLWRKDGSSFPVEYNVRPIEKDNIISGSVVTFRNITERKNAHDLLIKQQHEIQEIHKHTRESIEYAALIQSALIPDNKIFRMFFQDSFAIWHPKDIVGGDIYLMEQINQQEIVIMVIDCTGHGVPGAFVTMLVKAVERQLTANLHSEENISPADMLAIFNRSIKHLLQQEDSSSISNAGFDGSIFYYNKKDKFIRFAGAHTPLYIIQNNELKIIKGDRHSIGYKRSDANFVFTDHQIDVSIATQIYLTTDGYLDQSGGEKGFSFGKKRFSQLIMENRHESFADQQELLLYELQKYQKDYERNDDVTVIGIKI